MRIGWSSAVHPGRLIWNLRIHPWKKENIFQTIIFRFLCLSSGVYMPYRSSFGLRLLLVIWRIPFHHSHIYIYISSYTASMLLRENVDLMGRKQEQFHISNQLNQIRSEEWPKQFKRSKLSKHQTKAQIWGVHPHDIISFSFKTRIPLPEIPTNKKPSHRWKSAKPTCLFCHTFPMSSCLPGTTYKSPI